MYPIANYNCAYSCTQLVNTYYIRPVTCFISTLQIIMFIKFQRIASCISTGRGSDSFVTRTTQSGIDMRARVWLFAPIRPRIKGMKLHLGERQENKPFHVQKLPLMDPNNFQNYSDFSRKFGINPRTNKQSTM